MSDQRGKIVCASAEVNEGVVTSSNPQFKAFMERLVARYGAEGLMERVRQAAKLSGTGK